MSAVFELFGVQYAFFDGFGGLVVGVLGGFIGL